MQDYIFYSDFDILKEITNEIFSFDSKDSELKQKLTEICNQILKEYEDKVYSTMNNERWRCYLLMNEKLNEYMIKYSKKYFENNEKENEEDCIKEELF